MNIEYIAEFVTLAETCNFMAAADQLFLSQSTLSRHIRSLEEEMHAQLFDRSTRRVSLSPLGALFLPYAKKITALKYEYESAISSALDAERGSIRIGSIPMMSQYGITGIIQKFSQENPGYTIDITEGDTNELVRSLRCGQISLAFVREEAPTDEFNTIPFAQDVLTAYVRADHPFAGRDFIRVEDLRTQPLILLSKDTFLYSLCENACKKAGFTPRVVLTTHSASNMLDFVRKGMGVALLTRRPTLPLLTEDIRMVDIEPRILTAIDLCYNKNQPLSPGIRRLIRLVSSQR